MDENECSRRVIGAAIEVHRHLGPGMLEGAYEAALFQELSSQSLRVSRQVKLPASYKGIEMPDSYRVDLIVEDMLIVEVKAVDKLAPIHAVQLLTYLRFANKRLGLLLNFNTSVMKAGVKRVVNRL
jgi:GxxExxY protein